MNFIEEFKKGQSGDNKGIHISKIPGLVEMSKAINGIQQRRIYVVGAAPKTGKTTLTDSFFLIGLYLEYLEHPFNLEFIYFSFEIPRIEKEFEIASFFLYYDYNMKYIKLVNQTVDGRSVIKLSSDYLMGRLFDDDGEIILVSKNITKVLKEVYVKRIIPLFGEYDKNGIQIKGGLITFIKDRDNPTGLHKYLMNHAAQNGTFYKSRVYGNNRLNSYVPNVPDKLTLVITDHVRKIMPERNFSLKQVVDKYSEYACDIRDWCNYSFVHVIHTNRSLASKDNLKFFGDLVYPSSENIKETANLAEDANYVFTMFNPNDEKYNLKKHFGARIRDDAGNELYPSLRTIHLVESRHCRYPQHFRVSMEANIKNFKKLNI